MARAITIITAAILFVLLAGPVSAQTKPKTQTPKKPVTARPAAPEAAKPTPAPEPPPPPSDVKVVTSYVQAAQVFQNVTYVKGARRRVEFPGVVSIDQCDLQRTVLLNANAKRYRVQPYANPNAQAPAAPAPPASPQPGQQPRGGVVTLTTTLTDTLERNTLFGLEARRIKTVIVKQADANACDKSTMRTEIDAWYVSLPKSATTCSRPAVPQPEPAGSDCRDRIDARVVGDVSMGFPVRTVTTTTMGDGEKQEVTTSTAEVTALEVTKLDEQLFDVPADYAEASSSAELMPAVAAGGSLEDALFGSTADGTSQAAPKKPGITRVGILEPINKSGRDLNTRVLRQDLTGKFSKAPYEALPLSGSSAASIEADAKRLECDYILLGEITEVKTSKPGKMGGLLKMASGGGAPAKDTQEVKVSYRLFATGATASPKATGDVKVSSGSGFGVGSALKLAAFAGQMYMGMGMMRGFGGLNALNLSANPMSAMASMGGLGSMAGTYFDPRGAAISAMAMNMSSMMGAAGAMAGAGMADASDGEVYRTVSEAFDNVAKSATAKIGPSSR